MHRSQLIHKILITIFIFVAIGAIPAGIGLILKPDGSHLMFDISMFRYSLFTDFLIPGLVLLIIVGFGQLYSAYLCWKRKRIAPAAGFVAGNILIGWIVVQIMLIGYVSWMQPAFFVIGLTEVLLSLAMWKNNSAAS